MYHYEKETKPKLNSKSIYAYDKTSQVIVLHKKNDIVEVSLSKKHDRQFPAFDYKLIGNKLWSRSAIDPDDFVEILNILKEVRESFPEPVQGFGDWQRRVRD